MPRLLLLTAALLLASLPTLAADPPKKKVLTYTDQDIWATASGITLSPDGKFAAWTQGTANTDGLFILKNVATGAEVKIATGSRSTPTGGPGAPSAGGSEEVEDQIVPPTLPFNSAPRGPSGSPTFTPDSRFVYVPLLPTKAEMDKARADKVKAEDMPKGVLAVIDVTTGQIVKRLEKVRSFSIVGEGAGVLVLTLEPKPATPPPATPAAPTPGDDADQRGQFGPGGRGPGTGTATPPQPPVGNDLRVVNLADNKETTFAEVQTFLVTKDAKNLLYTVASKQTERNGVYYAGLLDAASAASVKSGVGRYYSLTWDRDQTKLAFWFDEKATAPAAPPPPDPMNPQPPAPLDADALGRKPRVFVWERPKGAEVAKASATVPMAAALSPLAVAATANKLPAAVEVLGPTTTGLKKGWQIVDRGGLSFTADGKKLLVSAAPEPPPAPTTTPPTTTPPTTTPPAQPTPGSRFGTGGQAARDPNAFDMNLWHWKDEAIQPMQKVRAGADRNKSYRCVYFLDTKEFKHVADEDREVGVPQYGDWGVGRSDKPYRGQTWRSPNPVDYALVNVRTGESKPLVRELGGGVQSSPNGKAVAWFDGKDWFAATVPDGKPVNLTAKLKEKFFNEEFDQPMTPTSYGSAGWSTDDKYLFVYDRFDLWRLAADGSEAKNITDTGRALGVRLRLLRVEKPDDDDTPGVDRGLDTGKPWLLAAENLTTRDTGFYRLPPNAKPQLLLMGARKYGPPTKAKKADTQILTVQTFHDYPDYYATDAQFKEMKRLTDINPRVREFNWGTAELVNFKSTDGQALQSILVKPENFDPSKKYPMVVYIYERLTDGLHTFRLPTVSRGQVINPTHYASNGYLVLMPDIAYKTGQPGPSAIKCVLPAIQAVVDRGFVNEQAIGINGQSWGGYQIAYMVTQTDRFKAAVAGAPVSNMISAYNGIRWGTGLPRQFQYEHTQSRIGGTPWTAPLKFIENSPVFFADKVNTPLLMIHNDADDAVPWYQGVEYYLALRRLQKEVYLLNYNNQPHNLSNRAAARDFAVRMQQFFDHHLKGEPMPEWMAKGVPYLEREKEKEQWKKLFEAEKK
ncbi:MAG: prolyl oligopeptidase family serine peptidase [Fimbriiglobus sp.]|nr:prolyl oligopeptidase family serine peptidase [Fimbriiglobus sp.]